MKAFIVLALVAVCAARSLDVDTLRLLSKEKSLLTGEDMLLKDNKWSHHRLSSWPQRSSIRSYDVDYTTPSVYGDDYVNTWAQRRVTILSFEELYSHPLFREYLRIPLFRQFLTQYPTVFKRYLESPLFQQFWTHPEFKTYFYNPVFFYKYIVPQVQVIAQTVDTFDYGYNYDNEDFPVYRREHSVEDYLTKIFGRRGIEHTSTVYPWAHHTYNKYNNIWGSRQFPFGGRHTLNNNNYKFLLDKIYRTLFLNKPVFGETTEVRTDVKIAPAHKVEVVEPLTGESKVVIEEPKIVDVKVDEKIVPEVSRTHHDVEHNVMLKEILLKKLVITKHISPELYAVLKTLPYHHVKEIVSRIAPSVVVDVDTVYGDDVTSYYPHEYDFDVKNVDVNDIVYRHKLNNIFDRLYNKDIVGDRYTPVVRDLMKVLGHHNVPTFDDIVRP